MYDVKYCYIINDDGEKYSSECFYLPQTKFAKVMFLHLSFFSQGGRVGV